jgi:hypothetical protein
MQGISYYIHKISNLYNINKPCYIFVIYYKSAF